MVCLFALMGLRRDRQKLTEGRISRARLRRVTPRVEMLETILPLSDVGGSAAVTVSQLQTEAANPAVNLTASADSPGENSDTANYITVNEVVVLGDQSQTAYIGVSQLDPTQFGQSPGTVAAVQMQTETATPTVVLHVTANASGTNSVAVNHITVNMDIVLGDQSQTLYVGADPKDPSQIGRSPGTVILTATQTQTEMAAPTVVVFASATASGANSVAYNYVTAHINTQFGTETQNLVIVTGTQDPSQIGQNSGNTTIVTATQTQTGTVNPMVNLSLRANTPGSNSDADNLVTVLTDTILGNQKQTLSTVDT